MPENLRKGRNVAIILGFVEIACCIASLVFCIKRKSGLIIAWIALNWVATGLGFWAKLRLSYWGLLCHAIYTISIIGGFYIYIFVDYALTYDRYVTEDEDLEHQQSLSQTIILILTTVPFLALFVMGIFSAVLAGKVDDELEERKK